jgi:hypothetical protein
MNPAFSHLAFRSVDAEVYLVSGRDEVCMVTVDQTGRGVDCSTAEAATYKQTAVVEQLATGYRVYALLPDGVRHAIARFSGHGSITLVRGANMGVATSLEKPASIGWRTATGRSLNHALTAP